MPPASYTTMQKSYISQFTSFTQANERSAARILKNHNWNLEQAIDAYYQSLSNTHLSAGGSAAGPTTLLNKLFDQYRDATDPENTISVNGAMRYFLDIRVDLEEITVFVISEALKCPTMGEFVRESFVEGWKSLGAETIEKQRVAVQRLRQEVRNDPSLFKRVYRHTFLLARSQGQKAVPLDTAIEYWNLFFGTSSSARTWNTPTTPWLDWYKDYLREKWNKTVNRDMGNKTVNRDMGNKTVNRDMWHMTLEFVLKSLDDESMSWWDEAGAWPGVLDDFVNFVNDRRTAGLAMEIE